MARATVQDAIGELARAGVEFFTPDLLVEQLGLTRPQAHQLAHRMAAANRARRVRRGLYALLPPSDWRDTTGYAVSWYLTAAKLAEPDPYYLAFYTAMEVHQMTQHPLRTVFIAVTGRHQDVRMDAVRFRFVRLAPHRFFGGRETLVEPRRALQVADLERTFIDGVDRPDLCGGIEEVFRGFDRRRMDLNADRLLRYVDRLRQPGVAKRLGFLLEAAGADTEIVWELERIAGRLKHYIPLVKRRPVDGATRNRRWELLVNIDVKKLRALTRS